MFVPILIDLIHYNPLGHLFMYYKFAHHCYLEGWPMIIDEHFYKWDHFNEENLKKFENIGVDWEYQMLNPAELNAIKKYILPSTIPEKLSEQKGSRLGMSVHLQNERYYPLEAYLDQFIIDIQKNYEEPIEGFIMLEKSIKSVKYVAEKYNLPLICIGKGPLRSPTYRETAYLCFGDLYAGDEECKERYQQFCEEMPKDTKYLSNKEIISIFLNDRYFHYLCGYDISPENEITVCGTYAVMPTLFSSTAYSDCEVLYDVKKIYGENYCFRPNPADPFQATYKIPLNKVDRSFPGIVSILNTKRIATMGSNIMLDAILWGKTCCCKTNIFPMSFMCQKNYNPNECIPVPSSFLNFFCFGYLIPFEYILNPEYIRWRLSKPTEKEIFERHLHIYLSERNFSANILDLPENERLKAFLYIRNYIMDFIQPNHNQIPREYPVSMIHKNDKKYCCINISVKGNIESRFKFVEYKPAEEIRLIPKERNRAEYEILSAKINGASVRTKIEYDAEGFSYVKIICPPGDLTTLEVTWCPLSTPQNAVTQDEELNAILNSTSWKITAPLRKIMDKLKRGMRK